ncbi:hypothetical protein LUZ60_014946 [Juncus effusus]|nr:hypothetical protein LUZ60_014946 [Juncus effusus]
MGKYLKKGKVSGEVVAVMDPPLGVRTRARTRTLALQKPSTDFLELRNRRLEKPVKVPQSPKVGKQGLRKKQKEEEEEEEEEEGGDVSFFGENVLGDDAIDRSTRESTPCNMITGLDSKCCTPGSATRPTNLTARSARNPMRQVIPSASEMDEFFSVSEKLQQRIFMEKYNFDVVNERPVEGGRYEWEKIDC